MNIIFFGSDHFAAVHLNALIDSAHHVVGCVTQPDRPKGRGMKVTLSEIKECAQDNNIPVLQPDSLKGDGIEKELRALDADIFVVIAYGRFLPDNILKIPPKGAVNVHASLLPKYRGAAPINWAIINGEEETGLTVMYINERMDAGDILSQYTMGIGPHDTSLSVRTAMMEQGPALLLQTLGDLAEGKGNPRAQDEAHASLAPKLTKELGCIDWNKPAADIHNLVRGLLPWPNAYTLYHDKSLKIKETALTGEECADEQPGTVLAVGKEGITVATGRQSLLIKQVHLQDAKPMDAHSFVIGHQLNEGYQFK